MLGSTRAIGGEEEKRESKASRCTHQDKTHYHTYGICHDAYNIDSGYKRREPAFRVLVGEQFSGYAVCSEGYSHKDEQI